MSRFPQFFRAVALAVWSLTSAISVVAQPLVTLETVIVGDAGNAADTNYGAVSYNYAIGKNEVSIAEYSIFLNTVASVTDASYLRSLWNSNMGSDSTVAGITRSMAAGTEEDPYVYSVINGTGNRPIAYISWFSAARFANWMNNGATATSTTETGAYSLNGAESGIFERQAGATWWIPSENEWYKAAYYKGGSTNAGYWTYPTRSDSQPGVSLSGSNDANYSADGGSSFGGTTDGGAFTNSFGPYGTFDMAGNVWEWNDAVIADVNRGVRGGAWDTGFTALGSANRGELSPQNSSYLDYDVGFRLASVPEPTTAAALVASALGLAVVSRFLSRRRITHQLMHRTYPWGS